MFRNRFKTKTYTPVRNVTDNDVIEVPCVNLGTKIANQMYSGVDPTNSTLLHGEHDSEDTFDVDPACDFSTDRFGLTIADPVPTGDSIPTCDSTPTE